MEVIKYEEAEIDKRIIRAVKEMGYEEMTPIQQMAIPELLAGKDIIGQAQTGTGKTAAFGIPLIQSMDPEKEYLQGIVLCPTRELAIQAAEELRQFAKYMQGVKILPIYGGQDIEKQIRSLRGKTTIVVGTPGRVMDHMRRHTLRLEEVTKVVLDEADEMLNMGFREDIETILAEVPENHQTALFSATMPKAILDIVNLYQKEPTLIQTAKTELTIPLVKQYYYEVQRQNKEEVVSRLLDYYNPKLSLIFCNTKRMVDELSENLKGRGYFAEGLHGDMSQAQRDKVMKGFRSGTVEILIATDVAARGIDVDDVEAVFNYDIPQDNEYYVHRIGRTGRAGRKGRSFTLVVGREIYRIRDIERSCNTKLKARLVPSVADINEVKAQKVFTKVLEIVAQNHLSELTKVVQDKINDEDITAIELCAAFLRMALGEEKQDIPEESFLKEKSKRRSGQNRGTYGENGRRPERKPYGEGGSRPERKKYSEGGNRPERKPYSEGGSRPERKSYGEGGSRPERKPHSESGSRPEREQENRWSWSLFEEPEMNKRKSRKPKEEASGRGDQKSYRETTGKDDSKAYKESSGKSDRKTFKEGTGKRERKPDKESFGKGKEKGNRSRKTDSM